ncbi:MAG TPA: hypothetical protein VLH13_00815 [Methanomassiliicoccales archaeon]|nr:hypothetical protein [Methanomassiliicoccales archaeon]
MIPNALLHATKKQFPSTELRSYCSNEGVSADELMGKHPTSNHSPEMGKEVRPKLLARPRWR